MTLAMTPARIDVLRTLHDYWARYGECPTLQAMADILGQARPAVHEKVHMLAQAGLIEGGAKNWRLTQAGMDALGDSKFRHVPVLGVVRDGEVHACKGLPNDNPNSLSSIEDKLQIGA